MNRDITHQLNALHHQGFALLPGVLDAGQSVAIPVVYSQR